jgi:hypothetical protein
MRVAALEVIPKGVVSSGEGPEDGCRHGGSMGSDTSGTRTYREGRAQDFDWSRLQEEGDCRPGPCSLSDEWKDAVTPQHVKDALAKRRNERSSG